ncbi:MAG TPA: hypothetical protein VF796_04520 [Humisphaera sp.]
MATDDDDSLPYRFTVAAIDLRLLLKQLKPAFPKKKDVARTRLAMEVSPGGLRWLLPGAAAGTVVQADRSFRVDLPFAEVGWIVDELPRDGEVLTFEFGPGRMNYRGVGVSRPDIRVTDAAAGGPEAGNAVPAGDAQAAPGPDGAVGLPLVAAYAALRKPAAAGAAVPAHLRAAGEEVEEILAKADKLLAPLGLGRADVERMLDDRTSRS